MSGTETIPRLAPPEGPPDSLGNHEILPKIGSQLNGENIVTYAEGLKDLASHREDTGYMRSYSRSPKEWSQLRSGLRAEMGHEAGLTLEEMQVGDALYDTVTWAEQLASSPPPEFTPMVQRDQINPRTGGFEQVYRPDNLQTYEKSKQALSESLLNLHDMVSRYDLIARGEEPTEDTIAANSGRAQRIVLSLLGGYKRKYEKILEGVDSGELAISDKDVAQRESDQVALSERLGKTARYEGQVKGIISTVKGEGHGHGHGDDHGHDEAVNLEDWPRRALAVFGVGFDPNEAAPVAPGPLRSLRQRMRMVTRKGIRNPDKTHLHYYALPQHVFRHRKEVKENKARKAFLQEEIAHREHFIPQDAYDRAVRRNDMLGAVINGDLFFEIPQNGNGNGNGYEEYVRNAGFTVEQIPDGVIWRFGKRELVEDHEKVSNYLSNRFGFIAEQLDELQSEGPAATAKADRVGQKLQQAAKVINEGIEDHRLLEGEPLKIQFIKEHSLASARLLDWLFRTGNQPQGVEIYSYEERNPEGNLVYNDVGYMFRDTDGNAVGVFWPDGSRASWDADNDTIGARLTPAGHPFKHPDNLPALVDPHLERLSQKEIDRRIHVEGDTSLKLNEARAAQDEALIAYDRTRTPESLKSAWENSVKLAELREITAKELVSHIERLEEQRADATQIDQAKTALGEVIKESLEARLEQAQLEAKRQGREIREVNLGALAAGLAIGGQLGERTAVSAPGRRSNIAPDGSAVVWGENVTIMTQNGPVSGEVLFNGDSVIVTNPVTRASGMYSWDGNLIATTA